MMKRECLTGLSYSVYYWRYKGLEVDFVVKTPKHLWGIEVKSGNPRNPKGIPEFLKQYPEARTMIVGSQGMALDEFFRADPRSLF